MRALLFSFLAILASGPAVADEPAANLPHEDSAFGCTSRADANRYLADFGVNTASFGGLELCNPARDTKKLLNDFSLIEKAVFGPDPQHGMVRGFVPRDQYYAWMKRETRGMRRGNDIPWATAYNSGGHFTMQDGWAALSTLGRVGTVIHEARHTAGYRHYSCTFGPYAGAGSAGCDTSYSQGGSHGVEMEYYVRVVLEGRNLHPVYKSMARLMALGRSNFVFNQAPIRKREALLGHAGSRMVLVDGAKVYEREAPRAPAAARLKRTSFGASLVDGRDAVAVDVYSFSANGASLNDDYSYYKLYRAVLEGGPVGSFASEELDLGIRRFFVALNGQGRIYSYNFPSGSWHPPTAALPGAAALVTRAPGGQAGLFVVKDDGSILPFDPAARRLGAPLRERWLSSVVAYAQLGGALVRLESDGRVLDQASGAEVAAFAGRKVTDLVNVPLYDAFEIAP